MLPDRRAVVFDLDDTLYPYRRFRVSGFLAVARHLEVTRGLDSRLGFAALVGATHSRRRGQELQACIEQHDLPPTDLPELLDVFRHHEPSLRLARSTTRVLARLRIDGWRVGVVTNGQPTIQARKIQALGLDAHVDAIVFAMACGRGAGKPEPEPFAAIAAQLDVPPSQTVFVGDDERCDIEGSRAAGMIAVRCAAWVPLTTSTAADAAVDRLARVPAVAHVLLEEALNRHAA
ncbi:MAG: HAD family hydrolase [Acidobacteriota bacterium]